MSCELVQKQLLSIMDSLVTSIVTEISQLDVFQSKRENGNPETITIITAAVRKITNSTTEHICRILHTTSGNDITQPGGEWTDFPSDVGTGVNCTTSDGNDLHCGEEESEIRFEEVFVREESRTAPVDEEASAKQSEPVARRREELNQRDQTHDTSVPVNARVIGSGLDNTADDKHKTCKLCGKTFTHITNLRRHEQKLHRGETAHTCDSCGEPFASRRLLQTHRRVHRGDRPHTCALCPKALRRHMTGHGGARPFTCAVCGRAFALSSVLKAHERTHGEKTFVCSQCGSRFLTKSYLEHHQRVHTGEKPYLCKHCGKGFAQNGNLKAHERLHTGERPFTCEDCGKSFVHANTFKSHKQIHSGLSFCCEVCGKGFRRGTHLKTHLLTHSEEKPFSCDVCARGFRLKGSLKTHRLTHTGLKGYACDVCNKRFTQASSLAKHKRIHSGDKPHRCRGCDKSFTQSSHLKGHMRVCQTGEESSTN